MQAKITIIGGGLAGSEAAHQLSMLAAKHDLDISIDLYEMRPVRPSPAHHTDKLAELVCSNSLGSELLTTARGLLIAEMKLLDSLIIDCAEKSKVPAGQALAVDREKFAELVTERISNDPRINLIRDELKSIPQEGFSIVATGPLTSEALATDIASLIGGKDFLRFFDAASPIVSADSINMDIAFKASRYDKANSTDEGDYINCPFYSQEDFDKFYEALISAERAPQKAFEDMTKFFESCLPIEIIASRGKQTLCFGPMKPVGLSDPRRETLAPSGSEGNSHGASRPVAVVQLRQDNAAGSLYNIVGFQTNLKWGEQKRVFSMIPGLENAEFVRYGVMHQNIYLNSPSCLTSDLNLREESFAGSNSNQEQSLETSQSKSRIYFAGQITGVEGYTESAATGIIVARKIIERIISGGTLEFPRETMIGALNHYVSSSDIANSKQDFQPMNSNWGLINFGVEPKLAKNKKLRNEFLVARALETIKTAVLIPRMNSLVEQ